MQLNYGGVTPAASIQPPASPLGYGGAPQPGAQYSAAANPMAAFNLGAPAPMPAVPGGPAAPQMNFAPGTPPAPAPVPITPGVGAPSTDLMTNGLRGAGLDAVTPATPFSWGGALKDMFVNEDGGFNMQGIGTIAQGIGALGSLWSAHKQNGIAEDALNFQKDAYRTNLESQRTSYNTALEDRIRSRHAQEGRSSKATEDYISKHRLGG